MIGHAFGRALVAGVLAGAILVSTFFGVGQASAAKWTVEPRLELKETYTDNVFLTGTQEQEDYISIASPGISIRGDGKRIDFNADYTANFLYFAKSDQGDVRHNLRATLNAEVVRGLFFVDGQASVNQQFLDRSGPLSLSQANITDNRATIQIYNISPYFTGRAGQTFDWELRYQFGYFATDRDGALASPAGTLSNSLNHRGTARISSGPAFRKVGWALTGSVNRVQRKGTARDFEDDVVVLDLSYIFNRKITVAGSVGYEKTNLQTITFDQEGLTWSAGIDFKPGPRTSLSARYGRRLRSDVYSASFQYLLTRYATITASYQDRFQTSQQLLSDIIGGSQFDDDGSLVDQNGLPVIVGSPGFSLTDRDFRSRRGSGGLTYQRSKTTFSITGFYEERIFGGAIADEDGFGANITLSRRLSRRATLTANGNYSNIAAGVLASSDDFYSVSLRYDYRLSDLVTIYAQGFRSERRSDDVLRSLEENGATISIRATF